MSSPKIISQAIGRRKEAVASVRLVSGSGKITVNDHEVSRYFPGPAAQFKYSRPFSLLNLSKYDISARVNGGGKSSQLDALVLGVSRCLVHIKSDHRFTLRAHGLLTRDSRSRQRRMVGMGGKSRRRKQSPKR